MNIIIAGNGKVGHALARQLSAEGHDLTIIDLDKQRLSDTVEQVDVMAVEGNCATLPVLRQAGVEGADLLIAATDMDEVNLLCCLTAHNLNPKMHTIARIRNPEYTDQIFEMREAFALSLTVNPERQAAVEIERLLKYPGFLRRDTFAKGRAEIVEVRVDGKSKLCNLSLSEILHSIIKCKVLVCAVLRNGTAMVPNGNFVLREGDRIFVTAPTADLTALLKSLGIITRRVRRVILCGGGRVSYYLAELLERDGISVQIIEQNPQRCVELTSLLPHASVVQGDCSSQEQLEAEGLGSCDALVTLTGIDEMNMITSLYGASRGVPQIITKLGRMENCLLADSLNLGSVICPRELCSNSIVRYVRAMQNQAGAAVSVHTIADGQAEAVEFQLDGSTIHCGEPLKRLNLKANVLVASITHGARTVIPNGDSVFRRGDTVVVVTNGQGVLRQFNDIFA